MTCRRGVLPVTKVPTPQTSKNWWQEVTGVNNPGQPTFSLRFIRLLFGTCSGPQRKHTNSPQDTSTTPVLGI